MRIGDYLYELWDGDWDGNGFPDQVFCWPVKKITDRFVYVADKHADRNRTYRFDRAKLEQEGYAYHRRIYARLYVRPGLDWPMAVISVTTPEQLALEGAS